MKYKSILYEFQFIGKENCYEKKEHAAMFLLNEKR